MFPPKLQQQSFPECQRQVGMMKCNQHCRKTLCFAELSNEFCQVLEQPWGPQMNQQCLAGISAEFTESLNQVGQAIQVDL